MDSDDSLFCGGSYLSYLGYLLLRSSYIQIKRQKNVHTGRVGDESESAPKIQIEKQYKNRLLLKGLLTNLANPKALIYFGSVFVLFVGGQVSNVVRVEIFALVVIETFLWFMLVAILFSLPKLKALYQSVGGYIDGIAGIFFVGFGLNLIYQSIMALIS